jgi:hypothetical protein
LVYETMAKTQELLKEAQAKYGDYISPFDLKK